MSLRPTFFLIELRDNSLKLVIVASAAFLIQNQYPRKMKAANKERA